MYRIIYRSGWGRHGAPGIPLPLGDGVGETVESFTQFALWKEPPSVGRRLHTTHTRARHYVRRVHARGQQKSESSKYQVQYSTVSQDILYSFYILFLFIYFRALWLVGTIACARTTPSTTVHYSTYRSISLRKELWVGMVGISHRRAGCGGSGCTFCLGPQEQKKQDRNREDGTETACCFPPPPPDIAFLTPYRYDTHSYVWLWLSGQSVA